MSQQHELDPEKRELEEQLKQLHVPALAVDRDQLMFQAGWAAALAEHPERQRQLDRSHNTSAFAQYRWPAIALTCAAALCVVTAASFQNPTTNPAVQQQAVAATTVVDQIDSQRAEPVDRVAKPAEPQKANWLERLLLPTDQFGALGSLRQRQILLATEDRVTTAENYYEAPIASPPRTRIRNWLPRRNSNHINQPSS